MPINRTLNVGGSPGHLGDLSTQAVTSQDDRSPRPATSLQTGESLVVEGQDDLRVAPLRIKGSTESPIRRLGLSEERPEILALFDFLPVYDRSGENKKTPGEKLDVIIQAGRLRRNSINELLKELRKNKETKPLILNLEKKFGKEISDAESEVQFLAQILDILQQGKLSLDIKDNSIAIQNQITSIRGQYESNGPRDILVEDLGFSDDGYKLFSNTRVMYQLIADLRGMLSGNPAYLFGDLEVARQNDVDPFSIDGSFRERSNQVKFNISSLRGEGDSGFLAVRSSDLGKFLESLPANPDDRLKLILSTLSREMRVSSALGETRTREVLRNAFNVEPVGDPFSALLGTPGDTIFDPVPEVDSYASQYKVQSPDESLVLPFETRTIVKDEKSYVPGSSYFIDSIVQGDTRLDTSVFDFFSRRFGSKTQSLRQAMDRLLDLDDETRDLFAGTLMTEMTSRAFDFTSDFTRDDRSPSEEKVASLAVLKMAQSDPVLKNLIFQYLILLGMKNNGTSSASTIYVDMSNFEVEKLSDLSSLSRETASLEESETRQGAVVVNVGIEKIVDKIIRRLNSTLGSLAGRAQIVTQDPEAGGVVKVSLTSETLKTILLTSSQGNVFKVINEFVDEVDQRARQRRAASESEGSQNPRGPVLADSGYLSGGSTRFNRLRTSTVVMLMFEAFSSLFDKYSDVTMTGMSSGVSRGGTGNFRADVNIEKNTQMRDALSLGTINAASSSGPINIQNFFLQDITSSLSRLSREDEIPGEIMNIIRAINDVLQKTGADKVNKFFDTTRDSNNRRSLESILNQPDSDEKLASISKSQVALSVSSLDEIKQSQGGSGRISKGSPFVDDLVVTAPVGNALFSMLREPEFREGEGSNLKIMSVGLPSGFTETLREKFIEGSGETFEIPEEIDVVSLDVYKRDPEFDDIIFKPISFLFEMTRFVSRSGSESVSVEPTDRFQNIVKTKFPTIKVPIKRFSSFPQTVNRNIGNIAKLDVYNFLSDLEKEGMTRNHMVSYLLGIYLRTMGDVNLEETEFLINPEMSKIRADDEGRAMFNQLVALHVKNIVGSSVDLKSLRNTNPRIDAILERLETNEVTKGITDGLDLTVKNLTNSAQVQVSEDLTTFVRMFTPGSLMSGGAAKRARITSPKSFERIFHIPVDSDVFEIDVDATMSTRSGREALQKNLFARRLIRTTENIDDNQIEKVFMRPRRSQEGRISFSEFFVSIAPVFKGSE